MSRSVEPSDAGLRERKKSQTRARLVEAALELSLRQGYDNTTVEQIAGAVEVSPRTFTRYFPSKDGAILTLLDDLTAAVNAELQRVPSEVPPLEALLAANSAVLRRATAGTGVMSADRFVRLLGIVNKSPTLQTLVIESRTQETVEAVTARLGAEPGDRTVALVGAVWSAIIANAWGVLGTDAAPLPRDEQELPATMLRTLVDAFDEFKALAGSVT